MILTVLRHKHAPIIIGLIIAAGAGLLIGSHFVIGSLLIGVAIVGAVILGWPEVAMMASLGSIVLGQLVRLPVGESAILPNDLIIPALVVAWTIRRLASRRWEIRRHSLTLPILAVVLMMGTSLLANLGRESVSEWMSGVLYFVRWLEYLSLFWVGQDVFRTHIRALKYLRLLTWVGVSLAVLGFIQLKVFPDFSFMVPQGWDPHIGRLLSTWFDPNLLGGAFIVLSSIALGVALSSTWRQGRWWWAAAAVMLVATLLTFSRSAYVGLVLALGIIGLVRSRVALFLGLLAMIMVVLYVPRVQERVIGIRTVDETAQLRLVSYRNALTVIGDHPVIGVGYNLYKFVQVEYNFAHRTDEHSASGSDSSLLTMWVTTGTLGLLAYLWLLVAMVREIWRTWQDHRLTPMWRGFGLGALAGFCGLFAHSQFVNGLQYPHLMELMWLLVAMAIAVRQPTTE